MLAVLQAENYSVCLWSLLISVSVSESESARRVRLLGDVDARDPAAVVAYRQA